VEDVICNLCKSSNRIPLFELYDFRFERVDQCTSLVRCSQCGLVYQAPRPDASEMKMHYPSDYEPYSFQDVLKSNSYLASRFRQYGINKRCRFITDYKNKGRLLEIGCGTGEFLNSMANKPGWEAYGLEVNPDISEAARQKYNLNIKSGTLEQANYQTSFFDAIALWDVLEHLHDPMGALQEIYRILKPDGLLVIRVPNLDSWDANIFGKYWVGLDAPRHLYVFDINTLSEILRQSGFQIKKMSCEFGSQASFILSIRFWLAGRGKKTKESKMCLNIVSHPLTKLVMAPYFLLIGLSLKGPELTSLAIKKTM